MRHAITPTLAIFVLCGAPVISHALSCAPRQFTLNDAYETADSIIVGLITECKEEISSDPWANGGSDCSFSSIEVLKESSPARDYNGMASSSGCGLSLYVGGQYLLFLDDKNQPMYFSTRFGSDLYRDQLANEYLRIIRDFRNGVVDDLSEPWMFQKTDESCSIRQSVEGNQVSFIRRTPDATQQPPLNWTRDTIQGQTVFRTTAPTYNTESKLPEEDVEIVAFGAIPEYTDDTLMLRVSLDERPPAPIRQARLLVGNRAWSLNRMEMNLSLSGPSTHKLVDYYATGDAAEQILAAMIQPSDIVVSATLIASDLESAAGDIFQEPPPEPVLRVESRSTQLSNVMPRFRACGGGHPPRGGFVE